MKKLLSLLLAFSMVFALAGCTGSANVDSDSDATEPEETVEEEEPTTEIAMNTELYCFTVGDGKSTDDFSAVCNAIGVSSNNDGTYGMIYANITMTNNTDQTMTLEYQGYGGEVQNTVEPGQSSTFTYFDYSDEAKPNGMIVRAWMIYEDGTTKGTLGGPDVPEEIFTIQDELLAAVAEEEPQPISHVDLNLVLCDNEYGKVILESLDIYEDEVVNYTASVTYASSESLEIYYSDVLVTTMTKAGEQITEIGTCNRIAPGREIAHLGVPENEDYAYIVIAFYDPDLEWSWTDKTETGMETHNYVGSTVYSARVFVGLESSTYHIVTPDDEY